MGGWCHKRTRSSWTTSSCYTVFSMSARTRPHFRPRLVSQALKWAGSRPAAGRCRLYPALGPKFASKLVGVRATCASRGGRISNAFGSREKVHSRTRHHSARMASATASSLRLIWKGVRSQPLVVLTSISLQRPSTSKLAMSYPAPSPSSSATHLTSRAKSGRPALARTARSCSTTHSSPARPSALLREQLRRRQQHRAGHDAHSQNGLAHLVSVPSFRFPVHNKHEASRFIQQKGSESGRRHSKPC